MNFLVSASTDVGLTKDTNQDSFVVKIIETPRGAMVFSALCDGMGGLSSGELASATVVHAFIRWLDSDFRRICHAPLRDEQIRAEWEKIIARENRKIMEYGRRRGIKLGTTVTAALLTSERYYILNVGDTRAYEIAGEAARQITEDQTVAAREVRRGRLSGEEARCDSRRSVLLQCVGASKVVQADLFFGATRRDCVYMLCTDGFRNEITQEEIFSCFSPVALDHAGAMKRNAEYLIGLNMRRYERDNISVVLIRTY
jgi:serine/threonine protein phosphatase PrpC